MGVTKNLWSEVQHYLPRQWTVFRKTNSEPYLLGTPVTNLEDSFSLVHSGRGSGISGFLSAKISDFFYGRSYEIKFREIA